MQTKETTPTTQSHSNKNSQNGLICKKCRQGQMLPAIEEGDPEYTDNFICSSCHYRDTIPTKDLLFSQILTAVCGIGICVFLLIQQLSILFQGFQHDALSSPVKTLSLILVAGVLLSGFIFVLFRAQDGYRHRKLYTRKYQLDQSEK